jgi:hypothetical protein
MTNGAFRPAIAKEIWLRHPDYRALSLTAEGFSVQAAPSVHPEVLTPPAWIDAHLEAWRSVFRSFGANPKKTPSSVESLWKRLQKDGALPGIHPVVDLYNTLSIRFGAPFGGEDIDCYAGSPLLGFTLGSETFDTARNGAQVIENPRKAKSCGVTTEASPAGDGIGGNAGERLCRKRAEISGSLSIDCRRCPWMTSFRPARL